MDKEVINQEVKEMIAEMSQIKVTEIDDKTDLILDLEIDSLALLTMVIDFETKWNIKISDAEMERLKTVGDISNFIEKNLNK